MKYKVLAAQNWQALEDQVNTFLAEGWLLQGGVAIGVNSYRNEREEHWDSDWEYCQAIYLPAGKDGKQ